MVKKANKTKKSTPEYVDKVLSLYTEGAPCHSSLFKNHKDIHGRPKEVEVGPCNVSCKTGKDYPI